MVARRFAWMGPASFCASIVLCMTGFTPAQEPSKEKSPPTVSATQAGKDPSQAELQDPAKRKALIDKMIAGYDLTPRALAIHSRQSTTARRCARLICPMSSSRPT